MSKPKTIICWRFQFLLFTCLTFLCFSNSIYAQSCEHDTVPPSINLNTEDTVFHVVNSEYFPTRATVTDNCSDSTNVSLTVNSNVNPYVVGCYQEYHTAVDSSGNRSLKIRTICVRSSLDLSAKVVSEDALFQVYPNPTSGTFQAQIGLEDREGLEVVVKNMLGETVERFDLVDEQNLIDIGSQPSGMYIVTLRTNGVGYVRKVFLK